MQKLSHTGKVWKCVKQVFYLFMHHLRMKMHKQLVIRKLQGRVCSVPLEIRLQYWWVRKDDSCNLHWLPSSVVVLPHSAALCLDAVMQAICQVYVRIWILCILILQIHTISFWLLSEIIHFKCMDNMGGYLCYTVRGQEKKGVPGDPHPPARSSL